MVMQVTKVWWDGEKLMAEPIPAKDVYLGPVAGLTGREAAILRLALHRFMADAYQHMSAAAQDKTNQRYQEGAADAFYKDAKGAEALLERLDFAHGKAREA